MFYRLTAPPDLHRLYNSAAARWHKRIAALGYVDAYRAALANLVPPNTVPQRVMDAGCGAGSFAMAYIQDRGHPAVLTRADPATDMLHAAATQLAGKACELILLNNTLETLPRAPAQDIILCAHVLDHCADPVAALRALGYCLAPKGAILLIATKPHWCNWLIKLRWRHHSYRPTQVLEAIVAAGLVCTRDMGFASGPPSRTSHAYLITLTQPEISYADRHR